MKQHDNGHDDRNIMITVTGDYYNHRSRRARTQLKLFVANSLLGRETACWLAFRLHVTDVRQWRRLEKTR